MADVSKIKLPNNSEYDIKDASAIHSVKTINNQSIVGTGNIDIDASSKNAWYGTCSVDKATGNKIVTTTTEDFAFETGSMLRVLFEDSNTQPSLNLIVDDGDPVPVKKIGAQGDIIPIDYTQLSSYQYRTYSLSEPLEVGSTIKVTINLNSPAGSQNFYTDSVTYISGTAESTMMFVYENQYIRLSFDGYSYVEVFSSYQWSVGISGSINTGSGYIGSESFVGYWHAGSVLDFVFDGECFVLSDGGTNYKNVWYGVCPTYGGNTDKMVTTVTGDFALIPGNIIRVKFDNGTSTSITRLSVDGTEATNVSNVGSGGSTSYMWSPGEVVDFVYDGNVYIMSDGGTATTTYYGATKLSSSTSSTSTSLAATPSAVKSAYDLANSKVSDVQVDGTSVVSSGTATISTSSTPTADTIAKFDSDAHMNSADMTTQEIDDFVDSVPSAFDNLNNLSVLHDITAGGDITDGAGTSIAKLAEVNYIHASLSSNQTLSSSDNTTLNLDTVLRKKGGRLTLDVSKHGVVVGEGVNNVEVFAEAYFFTQTTQAGKNIYVINTDANGGRATMARGLLNVTTNYNTVCTFEIFPVSEGDVITIEAVANSGTVIASESYTTKLIVRALG